MQSSHHLGHYNYFWQTPCNCIQLSSTLVKDSSPQPRYRVRVCTCFFHLSSFLEQRSTSCSSCCFFLVFSSNCACRSASFFCTIRKFARFFSRAYRETKICEEICSRMQPNTSTVSGGPCYAQLVHLCWSVVPDSIALLLLITMDHIVDKLNK